MPGGTPAGEYDSFHKKPPDEKMSQKTHINYRFILNLFEEKSSPKRIWGGYFCPKQGLNPGVF